MLGSQAHRVYEAQKARDVEIQRQVDEATVEMHAMLARCGIRWLSSGLLSLWRAFDALKDATIDSPNCWPVKDGNLPPK